MRNKVDHIQSTDIFLSNKIDTLAFLLAENSSKNIGSIHFCLAGRLHLKNSTLNDTLKTQRGLGIAIMNVKWNNRGCSINEFCQIGAKTSDIGATGFQHFQRSRIIQ